MLLLHYSINKLLASTADPADLHWSMKFSKEELSQQCWTNWVDNKASAERKSKNCGCSAELTRQVNFAVRWFKRSLWGNESATGNTQSSERGSAAETSQHLELFHRLRLLWVYSFTNKWNIKKRDEVERNNKKEKKEPDGQKGQMEIHSVRVEQRSRNKWWNAYPPKWKTMDS